MLRKLDLNNDDEARLATEELRQMRLTDFITDEIFDHNWKALAFTTVSTGLTLIRSADGWTLLGTRIYDYRNRMSAASKAALELHPNKIVANTEDGLRALARLILNFLMPASGQPHTGTR